MILRDVVASDLEVFFLHQMDSEANKMVGSVGRPEKEFLAHWTKTSADATVRRLAIVSDGHLAGYVGSFDRLGTREVCYWLGREFWGRGIATRALDEFLKGEAERPLYARVAQRNPGSIRVLEKCGFFLEGRDRFANRAGEEIEEFIFKFGKK